MRLDQLGNTLDPKSDIPLALQVARALAQAILDGTLRPGDALPGTRPLSETLGVSRYALLAALKELELEGFLVLRQGSGAYVADRPPRHCPGTWGSGPALPPRNLEDPAFDLSSHLVPISSLGAATFDLSEGFPDPRLAPQAALAKAYQRAVRLHGDELLGVGEPKGNGTLRRELANFLRQYRGLALDPECILITRGLRNGLDLILEALFPRGGRLGIEWPRGTDLWERATLQEGMDVVPIAGAENGLAPESLQQALSEAPLRAVMLRTPSQDPPQNQVQELLALAEHHRFAILEDDSAFPYTGDSHAPLPVAASDHAGTVVYLLSFGRLVAPGLRLGLLAGPRTLVDRLARIRRSTELQGDRVLEWALADLLRDGDLDRFLRRAALVYATRAESLGHALNERLGAWMRVGAREGLILWIDPVPGFPLEAWVDQCRHSGIKLRLPIGQTAPPAAPLRFALGFGSLEGPEQTEVIRLMEQAARHVVSTRP